MLLIGGFLLGPRVVIDTTIHTLDLPDDLESYLAESEAQFDDLTPGTEKMISWAGEVGETTPLSVVYLHGFSASRQELAPLPEQVAKQLGANLFETRFTGHGRDGKAMLEGSVNAWINDAHEAVEIGRRIGEKVVVIGVSTGATAAMWLSAQPHVDNIAALVLISPNFAPAHDLSHLLLWPWGAQLAELIIGVERHWQPHNHGHGEYWTYRYPSRALLPMMGMVNLAESVDYQALQTPTLMIYSPQDQVVDVNAIERVASQLGTSRKQVIAFHEAEDPKQHVLAGDILSASSTDALTTTIVEFVET